jgi:hypothetical protein
VGVGQPLQRATFELSGDGQGPTPGRVHPQRRDRRQRWGSTVTAVVEERLEFLRMRVCGASLPGGQGQIASPAAAAINVGRPQAAP